MTIEILTYDHFTHVQYKPRRLEYPYIRRNILYGDILSPEKDKTNLLGKLFKRIIEYVDISQSDLALILCCMPPIVSSIIRGKYTPSQAYITKNKWRQLLAGKFGDLWHIFRMDFEEAVAALPAKNGLRKNGKKIEILIVSAEELSQNWRKAVGEFVDRAFRDHKEKFVDIIKALQITHLSPEEIWNDIRSAKNSICIAHLRDLLIYLPKNPHNDRDAETYHHLLHSVPRNMR